MNDTMAWRKSSFSSAAGNCIEIGDLAENGRVVRDSKDPTGRVLTVPLAQWAAAAAPALAALSRECVTGPRLKPVAGVLERTSST